MRAIAFYCEMAQAAVLDGLQTELMKSGGDAGEAIEAPVEPAVEAAAEETAEAAPEAATSEGDAPAAETPAEDDGAAASA
jgi:small subunit ribosomal protein S2